LARLPGRLRPRQRGAGLALALLVVAGRPAAAQSGGAGTGGVAQLYRETHAANNWRRVLLIAAHPDDEDNQLLAILTRGDGIRAAYLSLNRGEGGQNLIGPELGDALGVLRSEELQSARRVDGAVQFFSRAYDFGFSKTADETLRFWNRDSVLKDMVRVIRRFRPQIVVSVFWGTPADGHGHHQASGILSLEAYRVAGDPSRFPELMTEEHLPPWTPLKFYRVARGQRPTLTFEGGVIDPATGLSFRQLAALSRSQHRSQGQGTLEDPGPSQTGLVLIERATSIHGSDDSLFAGVPPEPPPVPDEHAAEATLIRANVVVDATTDDDEVTPGEPVPVTITVWNAGREPARATAAVEPHPGFAAAGNDCPAAPQALAPGALLTCRITLKVNSDARPSSPYYLELPRTGAMYRWSGDPSVWGEPFAPPLTASFTVGVDSAAPVTVHREVLDRFRDPALGEVRRPVLIVPRIAVSVRPRGLLWPEGVRSRPFAVTLEHLSRDSVSASVALEVPTGWSAGAARTVTLTREGETAQVTFNVTAPPNLAAGRYQLRAVAVAGRDTFDIGLQRIRYPHVRARNLTIPAAFDAVVSNVAFPRVGTIGYVRGGGDLVPEALTDAGLAVTVLTGDALEHGPLDSFRVIVIGPRAYEANESLQRANPRLMRWLAAGGTLVIEYQQTPYVRGGFEPRPLTLLGPTQSRVTDETAPVRFLAPRQQILNWPNRITAADFDGWVQERGLDFPVSWDPAWSPILETHDAGDSPREGGLLVARVGKGTAVYTGLSFHRQLPALVPGAWRLFANILAVGSVPSAATHP
ncbi:MAG: PIG-L family deacetylase, partial [Gemmatimonadales bacterium]